MIDFILSIVIIMSLAAVLQITLYRVRREQPNYASTPFLIASLILALAVVTLLTGCATGAPQGPERAVGVRAHGGGVYSVSEMGTFGDPLQSAVKQCQLDGNKKLEIMGTSVKKGFASGNSYNNIMFRCEG